MDVKEESYSIYLALRYLYLYIKQAFGLIFIDDVTVYSPPWVFPS
jgi:hypothetical protein